MGGDLNIFYKLYNVRFPLDGYMEFKQQHISQWCSALTGTELHAETACFVAAVYSSVLYKIHFPFHVAEYSNY